MRTGKHHTSTPKSHLRYDLGIAFGHLGEYQKMKQLLERALPILERVTESSYEHVTFALAWGTLGSAFGHLGDYHKQKDLLERALSTLEREYGPEHIKVALTLGSLGTAFGGLGDYP